MIEPHESRVGIDRGAADVDAVHVGLLGGIAGDRLEGEGHESVPFHDLELGVEAHGVQVLLHVFIHRQRQHLARA